MVVTTDEATINMIQLKQVPIVKIILQSGKATPQALGKAAVHHSFDDCVCIHSIILGNKRQMLEEVITKVTITQNFVSHSLWIDQSSHVQMEKITLNEL